MKRLLPAVLLVLLTAGLIGCGPPRKSVFPPSVSIQQLSVLPNGQWRVVLRIQNNSYGEMDFKALDGLLQVARLVPVRLRTTLDLNIPALNGDVQRIDLLPTLEMSRALQAVANQGSRASLAYRVSGSALARPEQESTTREFDFNGNAWLSPVPGIPNTYR